MNLHENTDFGRKAFFLNTPNAFNQTVIPALFDKEYEIYVINDYRRAKAVLRNFPDSICFIDVDDGLSPNGWFNFMDSFEEDEMLSTIFLGIISSRLGYAQKLHFLMQSVVPAGFIGIDQPHDELVEQIRNILDLNGAKGRRRFVRADCLDDVRLGIFFKFGDDRFTARIKDISSAGLSFVVSLRYKDFFKINMLIREFSLSVDNKTFKCSAAVLKAFVNSEDKLVVVIVFTQAIGYNVRKSIREFLRTYLQGKITRIMLDSIPDMQDYTVSNNKYVSDGSNEDEEVEVIYADDAEEAEEQANQTEATAPQEADNDKAEASAQEADKPVEASAEQAAAPASADSTPEPVDLSQPDQA